MTDFIKNPNLPEREVSQLICGGLNDELIRFFESRGIQILYTCENLSSDESVRKHADISVLYLGNGRIIADSSQKELIEKLKESGFSVTQAVKSAEGLYPEDCILNHTVIGRYIIGKEKIFDESVKSLARDLEVVSVNQGYCKCSVLVVDENSLITDDGSVARKAAEKGIDCLLISKGDVFLDGHEYGFIGGASGKISKDEVVFFGDITKHRDYERIKSFLHERGIRTVHFSFRLTDFGGIIPLKENNF